MITLVTLSLAAASGFLARAIRLPGGIIIGAMICTAAWSLTVGQIAIPAAVQTITVLGAGLVIGMMITRQMLRALRPAIVPALLSSGLLIIGGIAVALLMRATGTAPVGDVLATSPGAMSVLTAAAAEEGADTAAVAMFHVLRIILILLTLPILIRLLPASDQQAPGVSGVSHKQSWRQRLPNVRALAGTSREYIPRLPILLVLVVAGVVGGLLVAATGISGGLIFGSTVGAASVTLLTGSNDHPVQSAGTLVQITLGWIVGATVTYEVLDVLGSLFVPAVLASVFVIVWGAAIALLLRRVGLAPSGDVLATSPGALEVLTLVAIDRRIDGVVQVALFHSVRMILVILSLPLLILFME